MLQNSVNWANKVVGVAKSSSFFRLAWISACFPANCSCGQPRGLPGKTHGRVVSPLGGRRWHFHRLNHSQHCAPPRPCFFRTSSFALAGWAVAFIFTDVWNSVVFSRCIRADLDISNFKKLKFPNRAGLFLSYGIDKIHTCRRDYNAVSNAALFLNAYLSQGNVVS